MNTVQVAARVWHLPADLLVRLVRGYQVWISPITPPTCRYSPTCSQYSIEAVRERGAVVGLVLTLWRLLRCNPWQSGGWDPVPHRTDKRSE